MIITCLSFATAIPAVAEKTLDITFNNTPVEEAISELRKKSGYEFVYQKNIFADHPAVDGKFSHHTLEQILNRIFVEDLNIDYEIVDKTVIGRTHTWS